MKTTGDYIISGGEEGKRRLDVLSEVLYPYTKALLQKRGLTTRSSFLDAGCGGGHVALMAAQIAGGNGRVIGVDFDESIIALNRTEAEEKGIANVTYQAMDAYDISYRDEFDMAYARFLLSHLNEPLRVLSKLTASVKPGGKVVVEDIHFSGHFCYPICPAFDEYVNLFTLTAAQRGHNANIGPELRLLFIAAGLQDVGFDVIQPVFNIGSGKWMAYITMDKIKDAVMAQGLAGVAGIQKILDDLEAFTNDENSIMSLPRIFRVCGTRM